MYRFVFLCYNLVKNSKKEIVMDYNEIQKSLDMNLIKIEDLWRSL